MKLGIMQPYFFPYIGYFQLMNLVDEFVVYDNIEFTKKGWINRNRILVNGSDKFITLPLKNDSDYLHVSQRRLAESWPSDRKKMLNRLAESYRKAPYFDEVYHFVEGCILHANDSLFDFIFYSLERTKDYLNITTVLNVSSLIDVDHSLKGESKVIAICRTRNASTYINPIGGIELYSRDRFSNEGIDLKFIKTVEFSYPQLGQPFVPWLSIIDVMMFNSKQELISILASRYTLA